MLPVGLFVKTMKPIKKIPMRLATQSLEDQNKRFYKMLNIEHKEEHTRKRRIKKNKTKKA
jgi:hypothetical protein